MWVFLAVIFTALVGPAQQASAEVNEEPVQASVSIVIIGLSGVDMQAGTFDATFYLGVDCELPCAAGDWDLVNSTAVTSELVTDEVDSQWWRVNGTFVFQPDVRLFPFDTQSLPIVIEHKFLTADRLAFVPNYQGSEVAPGVGVPGWTVEGFDYAEATRPYQSLGEDYSQITFSMPLTRSTLAGILKFYVPLLIFIVLGAATLFLGRNDIQLRTGGTALVGLTIFYLATSGGITTVGYLTLWDVSIIVGYVALGLVLLSGVIGAYLFHERRFEGPEGDALNKRLRFGFLWGIVILVAISAAIIGFVALKT